jgi:acetyl-CoA C-acetyltransferase
VKEAVIVSTARTGLAKSWKGALNLSHGATVGGHVVRHAVERAGIDPAEVEDVVMGCATPEGATGSNIARQIAIACGLPASVPGATVNRFCASGLQAIAQAAQRIIAGEGEVFVAGGVECISTVQGTINQHMLEDAWLKRAQARIYCRCCRRPRSWPSATASTANGRTATAPKARCVPLRRRPPAASTTRSCRSR